MNNDKPLSQAKQRLIELDEKILELDPRLQEEFRTVQERLRFLRASYPVMADYAILRQSLQISIEKGQ